MKVSDKQIQEMVSKGMNEESVVKPPHISNELRFLIATIFIDEFANKELNYSSKDGKYSTSWYTWNSYMQQRVMDYKNKVNTSSGSPISFHEILGYVLSSPSDATNTILQNLLNLRKNQFKFKDQDLLTLHDYLEKMTTLKNAIAQGKSIHLSVKEVTKLRSSNSERSSGSERNFLSGRVGIFADERSRLEKLIKESNVLQKVKSISLNMAGGATSAAGGEMEVGVMSSATLKIDQAINTNEIINLLQTNKIISGRVIPDWMVSFLKEETTAMLTTEVALMSDSTEEVQAISKRYH